MKISSLNDIVNGKLQNIPSISFVTQIQIDITKVNEGDAFISSSKEDIIQAVKKGAFAIITTTILDIIDDEIAWIKIDNINNAIGKILRYKLQSVQTKYVAIDTIFYQFLQLFYNKEQNIIILKDDILDDYSALNNTLDTRVIFSTNIEFLKQIGTNVEQQSISSYDINNLITHSLFETTFSYKDKFFERLKLPKLYINYLLEYCTMFGYDLEFKKLSQLQLLKPIFINKSCEVIGNGQSNRFLLCSTDDTISKFEIDHLCKIYNYAKVEVVSIEDMSNNLIININNLSFNALYIKGIKRVELLSLLESNKTNQTLIY